MLIDALFVHFRDTIGDQNEAAVPLVVLEVLQFDLRSFGITRVVAVDPWGAWATRRPDKVALVETLLGKEFCSFGQACQNVFSAFHEGGRTARDAGEKRGSASFDRPARRLDELWHKDLRGAASTTSPGVSPSVRGASWPPPCRAPAGKVCAEELKARARHSGGLRRRLRCVEAGRPQCGGLASPTRVRVWAAASGRVRSRVMGGDRVGRRLGGAYAPLWTSLNLPIRAARAAGDLSRAHGGFWTPPGAVDIYRVWTARVASWPGP